MPSSSLFSSSLLRRRLLLFFLPANVSQARQEEKRREEKTSESKKLLFHNHHGGDGEGRGTEEKKFTSPFHKVWFCFWPGATHSSPSSSSCSFLFRHQFGFMRVGGGVRGGGKGSGGRPIKRNRKEESPFAASPLNQEWMALFFLPIKKRNHPARRKRRKN